MKKLAFVFLLMLITLTACSQDDHTFKVPVMFQQGFYFGDSTFMNTASTGTGGPVYWNDILNKPATFPPSSHDHNLLYKPIGYIPTWAEISGKPSTFPASAHTHLWSEITNKPTEIELINELPQLAYLPLPQKTTVEINALVVPSGTIAMVWDKSLGVIKLWNGTVWKTIITNQ